MRRLTSPWLMVVLALVLPAVAFGSSASADSSAGATPATTEPPTPTSSSMRATTKAIELTVEGVQTLAELGGRHARPGYEFVLVDTSWKNVIPLQAAGPATSSPSGGGLGGVSRQGAPPPNPSGAMLATPYAVPALDDLLWLLTDDRYADTVDLRAQQAAPNHLTNGFGVAKFGDVLRGTIVFEAPANAQYRALQFFDVDHGSALIPLGGAKPAVPTAIGPTRENAVVQLAVSEAGFDSTAREAPTGQRHYIVTLRGRSKSARDLVKIPFTQGVFLQNDQGCVSQPEPGITDLARPFGDLASFLPTAPNEGQIAFLVPEDTKNVRVLVTPVQGGQIVLPAGQDFTPSWPAPQATVDDGTTMKLHVLPAPARPASLPAPGEGRESVILDVVLENLKSTQGIEFQATQQLRLMDADGGFIEPSPLSNQLACHLGETGLIPAGHARRFALVYDVPAGLTPKLQYRGFEKDEAVVEITR